MLAEVGVAWKTRVELANAMFDYLEIFHNRQRRHSSIGMLTPIEYEKPSSQPIHRMTDSNEPYARNPGHTTDLTEPEAHQSLRETRAVQPSIMSSKAWVWHSPWV